MLGQNLIQFEQVAANPTLPQHAGSSGEEQAKQLIPFPGTELKQDREGSDSVQVSSEGAGMVGAGESGPRDESAEAIRERQQERLKKIAEQVDSKLEDSLRLKFDRDENTGVSFFQLIERDTGDIVKQFPPEEIIEAMDNNRELRSLMLSELA